MFILASLKRIISGPVNSGVPPLQPKKKENITNLIGLLPFRFVESIELNRKENC